MLRVLKFNCPNAIRLLLSLMLMMLLVFVTQAQNDQSNNDVIKVDTELVTLDAYVFDKKDHQTVSGLTKDDFVIYEDGIKQELSHFSQDESSLSIVLLLDTSSSVWDALDELRANAQQVLKLLNPQDEVALIATASDTVMLQNFTKDKNRIANSLKRFRNNEFGDNGIFVHDSLYLAASQLREATNPHNRRVVIVLTDDESCKSTSNNPYSEDETLRALSETAGTVCGLIVNSGGGNLVISILGSIPTKKNFHGSVETYAEQTGGEVLPLERNGITKRFMELLKNLRSRYSLGFTPTNQRRDNRYRKLKVEFANDLKKRNPEIDPEKLIIKTRRGYYAKSL